MSEIKMGGGCNIHGPYEVCGHTTETCPNAAKTEGEKNKETTNESRTLDLFLEGDYGDTILNTNVKTEGGEVIEFTEDIDTAGIVGFDADSLKSSLAPFFEAGIPVASRPSEGIDGEDMEGYVTIKKEDINKAIAEGRLTVNVDDKDPNNIFLEIKS